MESQMLSEKEGEQIENEINRLTLGETSNPEPLRLQDVVDSIMRDPLELKSLSDKNIPKHNLNDSQLAALKMALNDQRPLVCIQGAPGTGKTHTLSILLFRVLKMKQHAVVLAPNEETLKTLRQMTQNLCDGRQKELKNLHPYSLMDIETYHALFNETEGAKEAGTHAIQAEPLRERGEMTEEETREERENRLSQEVLQHVRIVFATIESSFCATVMKSKSFDPNYCVIDGAAQVMESRIWPAVYKMKIVMAGDPKQLPDLVLSEEASQFGLSQSVMERVLSKKEHFSWIMLEEQYRSHKEITDWSNGCFYECKLTNSTNLENMLMNDLKPKPKKFEHLYQPKVFIDTSLEGDKKKQVAMFEQTCDRETSYFNEGEAQLAIKHYRNLLDMSINPNTVAIITPYRGQVELLEVKLQQLNEEFLRKGKDYDCMKTHIGTVDSVQGQEYDVVIFCFVRNNPEGTMGFVKIARLINVAVTRAKRHIMLIGSGYMLYHSHEEPIRRLFEQCLTNKRRFHPANLFNKRGEVNASSVYSFTPEPSKSPSVKDKIAMMCNSRRAVIERLADDKEDPQQDAKHLSLLQTFSKKHSLPKPLACHRQPCTAPMRPLIVQFYSRHDRDAFISGFNKNKNSDATINSIPTKPRIRRDLNPEEFKELKLSRQYCYEENRKAGQSIYIVDDIAVKRNPNPIPFCTSTEPMLSDPQQ